MTEINNKSGDQKEKTGSGWTPLLILAGVVTSLNSSLPLGYNLGVINTPAKCHFGANNVSLHMCRTKLINHKFRVWTELNVIIHNNIIRQFCNSSIAIVYNTSVTPTQLNTLWSVVVSIFLVGGFLGALFGGYLANRFGRKGAIIINNTVGLVAAILFVTSRYAHSVEMLLLARFIVGFSSGMTSCTVPMYLTEIAPAQLRGAMGALCPLGLTFGILLAQILGFENILGGEDSWHFLLGFYGLLILVAAVGVPFLPESPNYLLVIKKDKEKSIAELCRLRRLQPAQLESELGCIEANYKAQSEAAASYTMWTVLRMPQLRLPLLLTCTMMAALQLSGINAVIFYSTSIFETGGLDARSSSYATLGTGCGVFLVSVFSVYSVNRFPRRVLALLSIFLCAIFLVLITLTLHFITATSWLPYLCIASVYCYVISFAMGLAPIPYSLAAMLFTVGPRSAAASYSSMSSWASNFIVGMSFPSLMGAIGAYAFLPYALFLVLVGVFLWFYLPETKDRSPEFLSRLLENGFHSKIHAQI